MEKIQLLEKHVRKPRSDQESMPTIPPRFVSKLRGTVNLIEGDSAHIECQIEPINDPEMIVEILHNGQPLKTGSRYRTMCEFGYIALDILKVNPEDSGIYTLKISNRLGQVEDAIQLNVKPIKSIQTDTMYEDTLKKLNVLERGAVYHRQDSEDKTNQKPIFTQPLHNVYNLREGANAHLECRLIPVGDPSMKVEWFKNNQPLQSGNRFHLINDFGFISLDIHKIDEKDSGTYMVKATNDLGEAHTLSVVEIKCKIFKDIFKN